MNKKVTIIYGMSGSLKRTTMDNDPKYKDSFKVYSDTKPFFQYDEKYFNWSSRPNDAHLAIHRLLTLDLENFLPKDKDITIERGVTDNLFCVPNRNIPGLESYNNISIDELVCREISIICNRSGTNIIDKVLLVMKDRNFIENYILNPDIDGKYRKAIYPDYNTYIKRQNEYIEFTKLYNHIDYTIVIDNAFDYIEKFTLNTEL